MTLHDRLLAPLDPIQGHRLPGRIENGVRPAGQ